MKKPSSRPRGASKDPNSDRPSHAHRAARPSFEIEALEPRILLSGTWADTASGEAQTGATEGNDSFQGTNQGDAADGMGGDDVLVGDQGQDTLSGGAGDDQLFGGVGNDTLDGGTGNDQLFGDQGSDVLISGGGNDLMDGAEGNDTFQFTGAQHGDVITVDGGAGNDTIDLSSHQANNVSDTGSQITVNLGGGQSFTINHSGVENVVTVPANTAPTAGGGSLTIDEDAAASAVSLLGTDPDAGDAVSSYRIETLPTDGQLLLNGAAVNANDVVTQAQIDGGQLTFQPNADWNGATSFTYKAHDGEAFSADTGTFNINVSAVNDAPAADAGADQAVDELNQVTLDASNSSDLEGSSLTYNWTQVGGPAVTLSDASAARPTFVSPDVDTPTTLTFQVAVSDGQDTTMDSVSVSVNPVVQAPPPEPPPPVSVDPPPAPPPPMETPDPVIAADSAPTADVGGDPVIDAQTEATPEPVIPPVVDVDSDPVVDALPDPTDETVTPTIVVAVPGTDAAQPDAGNVPPTPVNESPISSDGKQAHDVTTTAQPTPPADGRYGSENIPWNDVENIGVLDPFEHLADSVEMVGSGDDAAPESSGELIGAPTAIDHEYRVTEVFTLPTLATTEAPAAGFIPPAPERLSLPDAFEDAVENDDDNARRWHSRFGEEPAFNGQLSVGPSEGEIAAGAPHTEEVAAAFSPQSSGFFARVWGAVRGLAATASPSGDRENDGPRGGKRT